MQFFDVSPRGVPGLPIFATNSGHAAEIYMAWWISRHGSSMPDFEVRQRDLSWPDLDTKGLEEVLMAGVAGVGRFDQGRGWMVCDPDDGIDGEVLSS